MAKETSTSELSKKIEGKNLIDKLSYITEFIKEKYGTNVWFTEILGKRWSYIAGERPASSLPPECIKLNEHYGAVSDGWKKIPPQEKRALLAFLKRIVKNG